MSIQSLQRAEPHEQSAPRAQNYDSLESLLPQLLWTASRYRARCAFSLHGFAPAAQDSLQIKAEQVQVRGYRIGQLPQGQYIKITISDNGIGLSREDLSALMDAHFARKKGAGPGRHYAVLSAGTTVEGRNTFYLYLSSEQTSAVVVDPPVIRERSAKASVLLMDDEEAVRQIGARLLSALGYEVTVASEGREAIALYRDAMKTSRRFAAVILDVTIHLGMGGLDCLKDLRKIDPTVKAIVSSGYADADSIAAYVEHGFQGVIAKPYQLKELSDTLAHVIGGQ